MHEAAHLHEELVKAHDYGWELGNNHRENEDQLKEHFNWNKLKNKVQGYIKSLNFGYVSNVNKV